MSKTLKSLLAEANAAVEQISAYEAILLHKTGDVVFVDLREPAELAAQGKVPGAVHIPRGLLEFHLAPDSPMHNPVFDGSRRVVFYCASGGRSALAGLTALHLGLPSPAHVEGGFGAWLGATGPVEGV